MFSTIDQVYKNCYDSGNDVDMIMTSVLYITVLENYKDIDNIVVHIIEKVIKHLPSAKTDNMRKMFI